MAAEPRGGVVPEAVRRVGGERDDGVVAGLGLVHSRRSGSRRFLRNVMLYQEIG